MKTSLGQMVKKISKIVVPLAMASSLSSGCAKYYYGTVFEDMFNRTPKWQRGIEYLFVDTPTGISDPSAKPGVGLYLYPSYGIPGTDDYYGRNLLNFNGIDHCDSYTCPGHSGSTDRCPRW